MATQAVDPGNGKFRSRITPVDALYYVALGLTTLVLGFLVLNLFIRHLTPDPSFYMLGTRIYLQEGSRFGGFFDSKGIVLTWWLAPWVALLGASVAASAMAQLVAFSTGAAGLYRLMRSWASRRAALLVAMLAVANMLTQRVWGGSARPEVFAWGLIPWVMVAAVRGDRRWLFAGGALAAACAFTKTSLAVTPLGILAVAGLCAGGTSPGSRLRSILTAWLWSFLGFLALSLLIFAYLALFDDLAAWYRQCVEWPFTFRQESFTTLPHPSVWKFLDGAKLQYLYPFALLGLALAFRRGFSKVAWIIIAAIVFELLRLRLEGTTWGYARGLLVTYIFLATALVGLWKSYGRSAALTWAIPWLLSIPMLVQGELGHAIAAYRHFAVEKCSPPSQVAAEWLAPRLAPGESVLPIHNDPQVLLRLDLPLPYPILPTYFLAVSPSEQAGVLAYYRTHPPDWIVDRTPEESVDPEIVGHVDFPYFAQCVPLDDRVTDEIRTGKELSAALPAEIRYRLAHDSGYLRMWKRMINE